MRSQSPRWAEHPQIISLPVQRDMAKKTIIGNEFVITVKIDGFTGTAVVPAHAFNRKTGKVKAAMVGTLVGFAMVALPPGSEGTAVWQIPNTAYERLQP